MLPRRCVLGRGGGGEWEWVRWISDKQFNALGYIYEKKRDGNKNRMTKKRRGIKSVGGDWRKRVERTVSNSSEKGGRGPRQGGGSLTNQKTGTIVPNEEKNGQARGKGKKSCLRRRANNGKVLHSTALLSCVFFFLCACCCAQHGCIHVCREKEGE